MFQGLIILHFATWNYPIDPQNSVFMAQLFILKKVCDIKKNFHYAQKTK